VAKFKEGQTVKLELEGVVCGAYEDRVAVGVALGGNGNEDWVWVNQEYVTLLPPKEPPVGSVVEVRFPGSFRVKKRDLEDSEGWFPGSFSWDELLRSDPDLVILRYGPRQEG
jgi:ABC-type Fe3+-hydroxamate transport system substrate-binding protein